MNYLRTGRLDLFFSWLVLKPLNLSWLILEFFRFKPKIVNLHFPDHQLLECLILKFIFRFKIIISLHGNEVKRMADLKKLNLKYYLYHRLFKSAEFVTGCSNFLLNQFTLVFPDIPKDKCISLYNGVNKKFIGQRLLINKKNYIFFAGRFVPEKGLDLLYNANRYMEGNKLLIAGGDENDFLELGLEKVGDISLLGAITKERMARYLSETRLIVVPSKIEGYGIIIAEAICCGSAVLATNVGGIPEVISIAKSNLNQNEKEIFDQFVILVEPDATSIKKGIETLVNSDIISQYLEIIPKIRTEFKWSKRLKGFYDLLL